MSERIPRKGYLLMTVSLSKGYGSVSLDGYNPGLCSVKSTIERSNL